MHEAHPTWPKVELDALVFWDEHHRKIILGHVSKIETRISRNEIGEPCSERNGGNYPPRMPKTNVKYPGEARGSFGVAIRTIDGIKEGVCCQPFNYTDRTVCSIEDYDAALKAEYNRVLPLKGKWLKDKIGYFEIYGENWMKELKSQVDKKLCCISDLMDHVVSESKAVYAGTDKVDSFLIFHDGLAIWWSKSAQNYLSETHNFRHRQWRCEDPTNEDSRYYKHKVVGDSPEFCRGLDSHGFADLKQSTVFHSALTSVYGIEDERRFKMGTPSEVWRTLCRCWEIEPSSARIIEDISNLSGVLEKIIDAKGCVVQDIALRTGRRYRRADNSGDCKSKPRKSARKNTLELPLCHPDALGAVALLNGSKHLQDMAAACAPILTELSGEEEEKDENSISDESDTPQPEDIESNIDEDEDLPV